MATESNHDVFDDVKLFMDICGDITEMDLPVGVDPGAKHRAQMDRYRKLLDEEYEEMLEAKTREQLFDAILDQIYVLIGMGHSMGFPMKQGWDEVCRSNMTKIDPKTGAVIRRETDGKILKPEGYSPPDLKKILNVHYEQKNYIQAV